LSLPPAASLASWATFARDAERNTPDLAHGQPPAGREERGKRLASQR
jgi:hypothetical protein